MKKLSSLPLLSFPYPQESPDDCGLPIVLWHSYKNRCEDDGGDTKCNLKHSVHLGGDHADQGAKYCPYHFMLNHDPTDGDRVATLQQPNGQEVTWARFDHVLNKVIESCGLAQASLDKNLPA